MVAGGFAMNLAECDPEIREAVFEALERRGRDDRHAERLARLRGKG